ncbi:hypothetical protein JOD20_000002 [Herpetosiphon giganteus]|nr:hypothetical protein [Herpetosiphon giganteus]
MHGYWLFVLVHWVGNQVYALTPSPSPTERGRGEHWIRGSPSPRWRERGLGGEGESLLTQ